jgi:hypothetical protein
MTRENDPKAVSQINAPKRDQRQSTVDTEVTPRIVFAERLAIRSLLGLDGIEIADALTAIATTLATAERWALAS